MREKNIMSVREIKAEARKTIRGKLKYLALAMIVHLGISLAAAFLTALFGFGIVVELLVAVPLSLGVCILYLNLIRKKDIKSTQIFNGLGYLKTLVPLTIVNSIFIALYTLLFIIPGIIKTFQYSLCHHILVDNPNMSQSEVREESMSMMEGNCLRYLWLHLSFVGWFVLSILSCGVLLFYTIPYMDAATAIFYENLKTRKPYSSENCEICKENQ